MPVESPFSESALSPDGNRIAFINFDKQIAVYNLVKGKLVTYPNEEQNYITDIGWSPDGTMLIYTGLFDRLPDISSRYGIYVVLLETGETICIVDWKGEFPMGAYEPSWSPDGHWISFTGRLEANDGFFDAKVYRLDTSCINKPGTCRVETELIGDGNVPTWSPAGILTIWCSIDDEAGPCIFNGDEKTPQLLLNIQSLTEQRLLGITGFFWSPDGGYFAFTLRSLDSTNKVYGDVYVVSADGKEYVNITSSEVEIRFRGWSPEGCCIAAEQVGDFESTRDPYEGRHYLNDIIVIPLNSRQMINLTNTPDEREEFTGWVVAPNNFKPGCTYQITAAGNDLNLRASPSLNGTILRKLRSGDTVTSLEGPVQANGYGWWKMSTVDGVEGWAVDVAGWYAPVSKPGE
jgi:Tol biopolymer transport system component